MAIQYADKNADMVTVLAEPYNLSGSNNILSISVDGGSNQVFTLTTGTTRTAAQIVADLSALTGATASVVSIAGSKFVRIRTTSALGTSSSILVNAPSNNVNSTFGLVATTYTGGAIVATTFPGATKQLLINGLETALLAAGWITVSGSGTTSLYMQSSMSPDPSNLRMRLRIKDNGNTCVVASIENVSGGKAGGNSSSLGFSLLPAAGKGFKVYANKYQVFVTVPGSSNPRDFACWGVPSLPSFLQGVVWEAIWGHSNAQNDTDTTQRVSFRSALCTDANSGGHGQAQQIVNNQFWEATNDQVHGSQQMLQMGAANGNYGQSTRQVYRWHDGSSLMVDPLIAWGASSTVDEALIRGQLWNAFISTDSFPAETYVSSVDTHDWVALTELNDGNTSQSLQVERGTLFLAVT